MHKGKTSSADSKGYPPDSLMGKLKERKIIATLAAFVGEDKDAHPDSKAEKEFLIFREGRQGIIPLDIDEKIL